MVIAYLRLTPLPESEMQGWEPTYKFAPYLVNKHRNGCVWTIIVKVLSFENSFTCICLGWKKNTSCLYSLHVSLSMGLLVVSLSNVWLSKTTNHSNLVFVRLSVAGDKQRSRKANYAKGPWRSAFLSQLSPKVCFFALPRFFGWLNKRLL